MESHDTRRRFEQWARNPACEANAISAILGVSMVEVAKREGLNPTMGQSPFALQRGQRFERQLFRNEAEVLRRKLESAGVLPAKSKGFADLRMRLHGGSSRTLDDARAKTLNLLAGLAKDGLTRRTPSLVAGATICVPGGAMLPEAILVLDALVIRARAGRPEIVVGEIKTYPDRGGYTDRVELAGARAQAGVYVHGLASVLAENGWSDRIAVSTTGFLILTRPGSNRPSVRAHEDLRWQAERAARGLEKLRRISAGLTSDEATADAVIAAETHYEEACVRFCDRAAGCFERARAACSPAVLGDEVARLLGDMSLLRVREIVEGARARTAAEKRLAAMLETGSRP